MVFADANRFGNRVVVGAVVGDVQLTVAVDQCQVSITIETACVPGSQRNHVTVEDIVDRGRGITKHRGGVGVGRQRAGRCITTGKDSIMDNDTSLIQTFPSSCICRLVPQRIQVFYGHILTCRIIMTIDGDCRLHFQMWLHQHLTVLSEDVF